MKKVFILLHRNGAETCVLGVLSNRKKIKKRAESFVRNDLTKKDYDCYMDDYLREVLLDFFAENVDIVLSEDTIDIYGDNGLFSIDIIEKAIE